jgi:hypothetical protein
MVNAALSVQLTPPGFNTQSALFGTTSTVAGLATGFTGIIAPRCNKWSETQHEAVLSKSCYLAARNEIFESR